MSNQTPNTNDMPAFWTAPILEGARRPSGEPVVVDAKGKPVAMTKEEEMVNSSEFLEAFGADAARKFAESAKKNAPKITVIKQDPVSKAGE